MSRYRGLRWLVVLPVLGLAVALVGYPTRPVAPKSLALPDETLEPIYFAAGTTHVRLSDTAVLDAHAAWLTRDGSQVLLIEGHTDESGGHGLSAAVGRQRAESAKAYLVSKGIGADRITILSRGGERPTCADKTPACRANNRRATFSTKEQ